jgi:hypothetical protein
MQLFFLTTSVFREFARSIKRPFSVRYNPYTHTVDILHSPQQIASVVSELKGDLCIVTEALRKIRGQEESHKPPTSLDIRGTGSSNGANHSSV